MSNLNIQIRGVRTKVHPTVQAVLPELVKKLVASLPPHYRSIYTLFFQWNEENELEFRHLRPDDARKLAEEGKPYFIVMTNAGKT